MKNVTRIELYVACTFAWFIGYASDHWSAYFIYILFYVAFDGLMLFFASHLRKSMKIKELEHKYRFKIRKEDTKRR